MKRTPAQAEQLLRRTENILARISHALPDWTTEQLEVLAAQMAELEMRCAERESYQNGTQPTERPHPR